MPDRLAFSISPSRQIPLEAVLELARVGDRLNYESIWITETWGADASIVLAAVARETDRIKLASGVFNVFSRSAALIAQTAATLQWLSGGRFIVGLGTSGPAVIEKWHGTSYQRPLERTSDYVKVIRMALAGDRVNYDGREVRVQGFRLENVPEKPVPIYIAALGPRNVRLTGRIADGWLPIFAARDGMQPLLSELTQGAADAGKPVEEIDVAGYLPCALGDGADRLLRQQLAYYIGGMGTYYASYVAGLGFASEVERLRALWQTGNRRAAIDAVPSSLLEVCTVGPEVAQARSALDTYRSGGVSLPVITFPHGSSIQQVADTLQALAPTTNGPASS